MAYDCKLIEIAINQYNDYMAKKYPSLTRYRNIFNLWAISKEGFPPDDGIPLRLLSDDDIITCLKNECADEISFQYFSRDKRYKPLWKSEAASDIGIANQIIKLVYVIDISIQHSDNSIQH